MTQNVGKGSVQVTVDVDFGNVDVRTVCALDKLLGGFAARFDNFSGVAS
jgi:hypothetical protein